MTMVEHLYRATCPLCDWRGAISSEYDRARANATLHRTDQHVTPTGPTVGELCAGYGGVALALESIWPGARVSWVSDIEKAPSRILAHHYPGVPNHGDLTRIDWASVAPVDILTAGFPCFAAGTPVLTKRGLVPIEDVTTGDEVWTHRARWRPVTATMTRRAPTVEFRPGFYCTPEHRLWLRSPGRVWRNDLRQYRRTLSEPEWVEARQSRGKFAATPLGISGVPHRKPERLTWWQVGRYLADGFTNACVNVYIGKGKQADAVRFPGWAVSEQATATRLTMPDSASERDWLDRHFGKLAHGKTLPAFALALAESDRRDLLDGYWSGDGHREKERESWRSVSVSPCLTVGIAMLATSLGYSSAIKYTRTPDETMIDGRAVNQRDWWAVTANPRADRYTVTESGFQWRKMRREPEPGPVQTVYDLTIADDHSFVAAGIVVHNCQPVSHAGKRAGLDDERWLFDDILTALRVMDPQPRLCVFENVLGLLTANGGDAMARVVEGLASVGYVGAYRVLAASDVGAPHRRRRVFILAWPEADAAALTWPEADAAALTWPEADARLLPTPAVNDMGAGKTVEAWDEWTEKMRAAHGNGNGHGASLSIEALRLLPTPQAQLGDGRGSQPPAKRHAGGHTPTLADEVEHLLPTPSAADGLGGHERRGGARASELLLNGVAKELFRNRVLLRSRHHDGMTLDAFGDYAPAVARWEAVLGRPAPAPTEPTGKGGAHRLSPRFVQFMMGLPDGWVTDVPDITRNDQLKALGNGVVPQQAAAALRWLLDIREGALLEGLTA
ncbi:DNA cytosine methyltransferase [Salana multivorans]